MIWHNHIISCFYSLETINEWNEFLHRHSEAWFSSRWQIQNILLRKSCCTINLTSSMNRWKTWGLNCCLPEKTLREISQWKLPNSKVWFLERSLNSRQKQWESVAMTAERLMINFIAQMSGTPSGALTPLTFSLIF